MSLADAAPQPHAAKDNLASVARHILFPSLPAALRHAGCETRALGILPAFGTDEARFFGIEVPLRPGASGFDVLVNLTAADGFGARLAQGLAEDLLRGARAGEAWHRCAALLDAWRSGEGRGLLDRIWLEFDLRRGGAAAAQPNLFIGPADGVTPAAFAEQLPAWFDRLTGTPPDAARASRIRRLARGAGEGVVLFQAGAMLARADAPVRICLRCAPPLAQSGVLGLLDPATAEILRREAAWLEPLAPRLDVALDVLPDGSLAPRLGLEAWFEPEAGAEAVAAGVAAIGAALVERGLADPARAAAIGAAEGLHLRPADAGYWPAPLRLAEAITDRTRRGAILHGLHHVKVTANGAGAAEAKAYFYCAIETLPAGLLPTASQATGATSSAASPLRSAKREAEPEPMMQAATPASAATSESACSAQPASISASR